MRKLLSIICLFLAVSVQAQPNYDFEHVQKGFGLYLPVFFTNPSGLNTAPGILYYTVSNAFGAGVVLGQAIGVYTRYTKSFGLFTSKTLFMEYSLFYINETQTEFKRETIENLFSFGVKWQSPPKRFYINASLAAGISSEWYQVDAYKSSDPLNFNFMVKIGVGYLFIRKK